MRFQGRNSRLLIALGCGAALLFDGCAHKKAHKKALEYEKSGRYAEAARKELEALDEKPDYEEALAHLQKVAPLAYQELLRLAETNESNAQWIEAVLNYEKLDSFLKRFQQRGIVLQTVEVAGRLAQAREKGTVYYYETAERHFNAGEYAPAIAQYKNVITIFGYHRDTKEKLWQAHTRLGNRELQAQQFPQAISQYEQALNYAADAATTNRQLAEAHYLWAEQLETGKNYREAMAKFESAARFTPNYRDAAKRAQQAYEKALQRVAIFPFRNRTSYNNQCAHLLTDELLIKCINANLKFAVFIDREHLNQIFDEYKLSQSGAVDESKAVEIGKLEGIHSFVAGAVTEISVQTTSPSFEEKTHEKVYNVKDSTGKPVEKREKIYFREYTATRNVQVTASFQIVDVATGRILGGDSFSEKGSDTAAWVRYQGSIKDLPDNKQKLLDASGEPKAAELMSNDLVRVIAGKISQKVIEFYR